MSDDELAPLRHASASAMAEVLSAARRIAAADANALLLGEAGLGKAALALHIHREGARADGPFLRVRCEGASERALHRALFGDDDLGYMGGLFGAARGGTLVMEEMAELPPGVQATLVNALWSTGSADTLCAGRPVRVIATTSRPIDAALAGSRLRRDLVDLLAVPLVVPPLRDRREDAAFIARACWDRLAIGSALGPEALEVVSAYPWPGNVRQLEAFVVRLATSCAGAKVGRADAERALPREGAHEPLSTGTGEAADLPSLDRDELARQLHALGLSGLLDALEQSVIQWALGKTSGSRKAAADLLGMKRTTLVEKLRRRSPRAETIEPTTGPTGWKPRLVVR
jgi:sigma-54 dependent transcriptional regulator, flagellar regulatory protein